MPNYSFFGLGETSVLISGGGQLDGITQGDGSHLIGRTITLISENYEEISIRDGGRGDVFFDDNDGDQRLRQTQTFDEIEYDRNTIVEAEYTLVMLDPNTGIEYRAVGVNFREPNSGLPSYATVEGLAFVDVLPPVGVDLIVTDAFEGPGDFGVPRLEAGDIAEPGPICFTPGTMIRTPEGTRPVEELCVGDLVETVDNGPQPVRWIGTIEVGPFRMAMAPSFRPIRIRKDAFGKNNPSRDLMVSPQHRILVEGWKAELLFGENQILAAAAHLVDDCNVVRAWDVTQTTYIHLQFDEHELVYSNGLVTESLNPGPMGMAAVTQDARDELAALFPDRDLTQTPAHEAARRMITQREASALTSAA